ncbi:hypothetical protein [Rhizobium paknamense]|uniref:DUF3426 domain-containing protein n=2 Tax=Rhizobium paknamense TaxID=1206817 RepID=A0ABU0IE98_9HYPH|nr:hypothetical protein [Rhizobium paknamense]MDQ0456571.1 hypothetical protein [Rhizobium paknamense]
MSGFGFRRKRLEPDVDLLLPERRPRPAPRPGFVLADDIVDASFVTVKDPVGDLRARLRQEFAPKGVAAEPTAAERLHALTEQMEMSLHRLSVSGFVMLVAVFCLSVFLLAGGTRLILGDGNAAAPAKPLDISHVTLTEQDSAGMPVLLVNAILENHGPAWQALPPVRADLYLDGRLAASTLIDPPAAGLEPGHSRGIAARLRHPGGKNPQLKLSFDPSAVAQR